MFVVLDKDTIVEEIISHLPKRKRGFKPKSSVSEIINCILYGGDNLSHETNARENYLKAVKLADKGDYSQLIEFARS